MALVLLFPKPHKYLSKQSNTLNNLKLSNILLTIQPQPKSVHLKIGGVMWASVIKSTNSNYHWINSALYFVDLF